MALLVAVFLISSIGDAPLGTISYVNGNPIPGVAINYSGAANGSTGTNNNGNYVIDESLSNGDVLNISPQAGSLACELDCINVHDLYLISEHIQGNNTLDPYGILAADANASESITSLDLTAITFLLLGFNSEYSENNCEGFVPADYSFVDVTNPFVAPIPQSVDYTHGVSPESTLNFNYYQVGDVNQCNDDPVGDDLTFRITDNLTLNPNDQVSIPITVENFSNITGFQFTVEWDPTIVTYLGQGGFGSLADYTTFDLGQSESSSGFLRTVWLSESGPQSNPDGSLLFAMQFEAVGSPGSSTPISINGSKIAVLGLDDVVQPILPNTEDGSITIAGEVPVCEFGLNTTSLADTAHACCWTLDFFNEGAEDIYAIELSTQGGVTLDYTLGNGFYAPNYSSTSVLISPDPLGPIPATANSIVEICLNNAYVNPQLVTVDYWNSEYEITCSETLTFDCPIEAMCLAVLSDTLSCDSVGYNYSLEVAVPPGADYDLGLIKLNVTAPAVLVGEYPLTFTPALQPGDQVMLDFTLPTSNLFSANDSLCYILTAHNGPGEELCCFALDTCFAFPVCDPCPDVAAMVSDLSEDCCYQLALTNDYTDASGYFSQVQTTILTPSVSFSDINYNLTSGWQQASSTNSDILWNFNGGVPNGTFNFFDFCIDGVTTTDSVCVAVNWLNNENVVCRDTVKVFCPDCLLFTEEEITCNPATGVYTYTFSGQNRSSQDANTISLLEDDPN
ncbi:MAG: cohesin domain-containing protein, partial [Bacteroidota bacterium]